MGYSRKNSKQGALRIWNFQEYQRNSMWNFQGLIKNEVEFPGVFVFGFGVSKGSNTILWNIQGLSLVLSGIFGGKVKKMKNSREFFKKVYPQHPCFDFFWNSPILPAFLLTFFHLTEASLSAISWIYTLVCAVEQKYHEMSFIYNHSHF